jgi:ABC-type multidrug transport system fused ATPase/permease subunit
MMPPGDFSFAVLRKFGAKYLKGHFGMIAAYVIGHLLVQTILPQQTAVYLGKLTNHFSSAGSTKGAPGMGGTDLLGTYGFWIAFTLVLLLARFGFQWLVARMDGKITNGVKADLFSNILRQPPRFFHQHDSDRLTMIVNQYSNQIASSLRRLLIEPLLQVVGIAIIGSTICAALIGLAAGPAIFTIFGLNGVWVLFGATVLFAFTSPWVVNHMGKFLQEDTSAVQEQHLGLATLVGGALKAPEEIQAMRAEPVFQRKLDGLLDGALTLQMRQVMTMERINTFSQLPGTIVLAAFLGLAIVLEMKGATGQPGTIVQVALLTPLLMGAIQQLSGFGITMRMSWPPMRMIESILTSSPPQEPIAEGKTAAVPAASLEARDLVFSYIPGERPNVLNGASFLIPEGKVTGFVARPGQGKTTFFRLALRFYNWQSGEILLGGVPIRELPLSTVRSQMVLMSQFPAFFYDTVRENLRVAAPDATDAEIMAAAQLTGLDAVLKKSMGDEPLGKPFAAGSGLSGGQKKLFALTRCLLRKPSVLFLDEPTTGMGPMEKFPLIETMRRSLAGKTVVVVDHDIVWQSRFCDHFHVLNDGKIIQSGTATELLAREGLFKELYNEASGASNFPAKK